MGAMSREKGKRGEREVAAIISDLLGVAASRRVRQHEGDSDILGVPGWSIEVKLWSRLETCLIGEAWKQACQQASADHAIPALFYRANYRPWRVRWPLAALLGADWPDDPLYAVDSTPEAWAAVVREIRSTAKYVPIAKARVHRSGGNAGLAWSAVSLDDGCSPVYLRDGEVLYVKEAAK